MSEFSHIIARKGEDLKELELFSSVCSRALAQAEKAVEMIDAMEEARAALGESPLEPDELARAKERAAEVANFASSQNKNGAPYLYSLCSIRLWVLIEALVDELVIEALKTPQNGCNRQLLGKLKGPIVEFMSASPDDQAELLAETLKQAVDAPIKLGVGRFEAVLEPIGLGGEINDVVRKILFELSQVRNLIVHKSGIADRRFVEACPWVDASRGKPLHVSADMYYRYNTAVYGYFVEIRGRVSDRAGSKRTDEVNEALQTLISHLQDLDASGSGGADA